MIVVITGAPGAGKGTQGDLIVERLGYRKVSTGDAFRRHIKQGTELGKVVESVLKEGTLVSDELLLKVLESELGQNGTEKILLDGYPRNLAQAKTLSQLVSVPHKVVSAVHLDVPREELIRRLSGRRVCEGCGKGFHIDSAPPKVAGVCDACGKPVVQRPDDAREKVDVRLKIYDEQTEPVLGFYRDLGLYHKIDGCGEQEAIYAKISSVMKLLA